MLILKNQTEIKIRDGVYIVECKNENARSATVSRISLEFRRDNYGVILDIIFSGVSIDTNSFYTKAAVKKLWMLSDNSGYNDSGLKIRTKLENLDELPSSFDSLKTLITTHFPTNWLMLLDDK